MLYTFVAVGILIVVFLAWRFTSVARGVRQRDEKLMVALNPIADRLANKEPVAADEIAVLIRQPQYRPMLYQLLKHFERLDLFPASALSIEAQGEGVLAYWMMHPNELQDAPRKIEFLEEIEREFRGESVKFLVFKYQMPSGHWASDDGWLLGLAGPFFENDVPYSGNAAGFSRCTDKYGEVQPHELIDWYAGMLDRKMP